MKHSSPDADNQEPTVIRGTVQRVTFHNAVNGFSVLKVQVVNEQSLLSVVGNAKEISAGAHIVAHGSFQDHHKFGRQFSAQSVVEVPPSTTEGIEKYLASARIKGIGAKTAKRIVKAYGDDAVRMIVEQPETVAKLSGVGKKKATLLRDALSEQHDLQEVVRFLVEHNVSPRLAEMIYERFGARAIEVLKRDPYILARSFRGVGFQTADSIAFNLGLDPQSPQRLRAGLYYTLERASDDGHCCLPFAEVVTRAERLLRLPIHEEAEAHIEALKQDHLIQTREDMLYLSLYDRAEHDVAKFIAARCKKSNTEHSKAMTDEALALSQSELGITFSQEQRHAVEMAMSERLLVITGGPGCGKTTVIRALSRAFSNAGKRLMLAAPTGRAAQRMSSVCGKEARTIHRMLRYDPRTNQFVHDANDPLPADAVIIDESSMVDITLAQKLFAAIPDTATLLLVGDKDQLPSVGPGRVFGDILSSPGVPTVSLSKLFRRAESSRINDIAHAVNSGIVPDIPQPGQVDASDVYFIPRVEGASCASLVETLVADQIPKKFAIPPEDITVLTPSNRGPLGTLALNRRLQERLNPLAQDGFTQYLAHGEDVLRQGDRVCQRVNNYHIHDQGVFNGDTGTVYSIDAVNKSVVVELWDGRHITYQAPHLAQLSLAYAVTVHRSQGSELPCVVLVLSKSHYTLLERQLLYTAITRAKELLVVVGSPQALTLATRRMNAKRRYCMLRERIISQA